MTLNVKTIYFLSISAMYADLFVASVHLFTSNYQKFFTICGFAAMNYTCAVILNRRM